MGPMSIRRDHSALRRIRAALEQFRRFLMLLIRGFGERPKREETARKRAQAANRTRKAMFMTKFGPFTGPASDRVLGMELGGGHKRPQTDPKDVSS